MAGVLKVSSRLERTFTAARKISRSLWATRLPSGATYAVSQVAPDEGGGPSSARGGTLITHRPAGREHVFRFDLVRICRAPPS
jgi:hypothetical protein